LKYPGSRKRELRVGTKNQTMATKKKTATKSATKAAAKPIAKKKAAPKSKKKAIKKAAVAAAAVDSGINIDVEYRNGVGNVTVKLFSQGVMKGREDVTRTGSIRFATAQAGDAITLNGNSPKAKFTFSRTMEPASPRKFEGLVNEVLRIL
jgi:hypothetical protein